MSVVDFSRAKVEMYTTGDGQSPFRVANINMGANFFKTFPYTTTDSNGGKVEHTRTQNLEVVNENATFTQFLYQGLETYMFSGSFKASGNSFIIMADNRYQGWKVSNVKYNEFDTYVFAICINVPNS